MRRLLEEIGELGAVPARARAGRCVGQLPLAEPFKDLLLLVLERQRSTEGITDTVTALVDVLESGIRTAPPAPLIRLPVWPHPDDPRHVAMIPACDVVYAFTGGALTQGCIRADWRLEVPRREERVYLRVDRFTDRDPRGIGVLATPYRTLGDLGAVLDRARFVRTNQSTVVNVEYVQEVDTLIPVELTVALGDRRIESLRVSRECWRVVRPLLGLTARRRRRPAAAGSGR